MTIPKKFQIFDKPVELSDKDAARLSSHLSGWMKLHTFFLEGVNEPDLQRLLVIEMMGMRRRSILDRLLSRIGSSTRDRIQAKVSAAIK
jgi:hypothetical protein